MKIITATLIEVMILYDIGTMCEMNCMLASIFAAAQMLFPAADTKPEGYDGAKVRVEDGAAVVDVAANHKFSGVNFVLPNMLALNCHPILGDCPRTVPTVKGIHFQR